MIKVTKWISEDETNDMEISFGSMGGFFNSGMFRKNGETGQRWKDYVKGFNDKDKQYAEALKLSILKNNIRLTGEQHQKDWNGVPLFSDNTFASFSFRGWGDLMAAIWSEAENKDYSYMDFYM